MRESLLYRIWFTGDSKLEFYFIYLHIAIKHFEWGGGHEPQHNTISNTDNNTIQRTLELY